MKTGGLTLFKCCTHSGLWVDERSDSVHRHTQVFTVFEVNAVVSKHVAATQETTLTPSVCCLLVRLFLSQTENSVPPLILKITASLQILPSSAFISFPSLLDNKYILTKKRLNFNVSWNSAGCCAVTVRLHPTGTAGRVKQTSTRCVNCTYCSMSSSLSTNTSMSKVSLLPSRTETNKRQTWKFLLIRVIKNSRSLCLLTFLGVGVGLDLQDHRSDGISVHVVERVGDPLRTKELL